MYLLVLALQSARNGEVQLSNVSLCILGMCIRDWLCGFAVKMLLRTKVPWYCMVSVHMAQYAEKGFCQEQNREQEDKCVILAFKTGKPQ